MSPTWTKFPFTEASTSSDLHTVITRTESSGKANLKFLPSPFISTQTISGHVLRQARERWAVAKANTQDALSKYMNCLDTERSAQADVVAAEEQRDELCESN